MKQYFGYIRVSDPKQGKGVSLQEQREAILRYGSRNGLNIIEWFEERETAAKRGRSVFTRMLKLLQKGRADGVVIHKIDRSTRNLRDWADLGEMVDHGIDIRFVNESLDLHTRGGRLSADIQAVVAADFIRNLREETRKGFYGRLHQGLYPLPAPLGYRDCGSGKPKIIDPSTGPLVRRIFDLYATGRYSLKTLLNEADRIGLRTKGGGRLTVSSLSYLLNNPFYLGLIKLKATGEVFAGIHPALISKSLFERVRAVLRGKVHLKVHRREFLFRRMLTCTRCGYTLSGERQRGYAYYRCHTPKCRGTSIREDAIEAKILSHMRPMLFSMQDRAYFLARGKILRRSWADRQKSQEAALRLKLDHNRARLLRLTDALIDGTVEKSIYENRKEDLLMEQKGIEEAIDKLSCMPTSGIENLLDFLELAGSLYLQYISSSTERKRILLLRTTSNREVDGKEPYVTWKKLIERVKNREAVQQGSPQRNEPRSRGDLPEQQEEDIALTAKRCEPLLQDILRDLSEESKDV